MGKRTFDLAISALGLVALSPLYALLFAAVKLTSRGPILFRQVRLGQGGQPFVMFKLRSMEKNAALKGAHVTVGGDERVTPLGRFLRHTKLDELPQLVNVLRGDMSFVGPRPEVPEFAEMFPEQYRTILAVRPGITHRATLVFRREEKILAAVRNPHAFYVERVMPCKLALYIEQLHDSLAGDIATIVETVLPWKDTPALTAYDLLDAPLVANIPAYPEATDAAAIEAAVATVLIEEDVATARADVATRLMRTASSGN